MSLQDLPQIVMYKRVSKTTNNFIVAETVRIHLPHSTTEIYISLGLSCDNEAVHSFVSNL